MSVLVTGGTGYIALHIIDQLLAKSYPVITTVRSVAKGDDLVKKFRTRYPRAVISYEVVENIAIEDAFHATIENIGGKLEYVLHTASPFSYGNKEDFDSVFVKPAVNGTLGILKAIAKYAPKVKKVVVTSSFAAIWNYGADSTFIHNEKVWNPLSWEESKDHEMLAYCYSKTLAEKSAWEFVKTEKPSFDFSVITPPLVIGPQCFDEDAKGSLNTSAMYISDLLDSTPAEDGKLFDAFNQIAADVRDVAEYHLFAMTNQAANGERLVPYHGIFTQQKALNYINKAFPELKGKISVGKPEGVAEQEGSVVNVDFTRTQQIIQAEPISFEKSVYDAVEQLLKARAA